MAFEITYFIDDRVSHDRRRPIWEIDVLAGKCGIFLASIVEKMFDV